nr:hypothetical protein [Tanacetum cinerariifolium]
RARRGGAAHRPRLGGPVSGVPGGAHRAGLGAVALRYSAARAGHSHYHQCAGPHAAFAQWAARAARWPCRHRAGNIRVIFSKKICV